MVNNLQDEHSLLTSTH